MVGTRGVSLSLSAPPPRVARLANIRKCSAPVNTQHSPLNRSTRDQVLMGQASAAGEAFMADVYSFGVTIWEIYAGKLPWEGMKP